MNCTSWPAICSRGKKTLLYNWESAVRAGPELKVGASLGETDFFDHVPCKLAKFAGELREFDLADESATVGDFNQSAADHGIRRYQQGYSLRELARELGRLNECLVREITVRDLGCHLATGSVASEGTIFSVLFPPFYAL
jgi:hypothetical protein